MILNVKGMSCNHCKKAVEEGIGSKDYADKVLVDLNAGTVKIDGTTLDKDQIISDIEALGYEVV